MNGGCVILLVEDDSTDAFFVMKAFERLGFKGKVQHCWNTNDAKQYLKGEGEFHDRNRYPAPSLIISDSTMTKGDGVELREWINAQKICQDVPFAILSGGVSPDTEARAKKAGIKLVCEKSGNIMESTRQMKALLFEAPEHCREGLKE